MSYPLWDLAGDLAVARGGGAIKTDPMEEVPAITMRRRLAALLWVPSATGVVALASWTGTWVVGVAGFAILIAALWLFAERGDKVLGRIRGPREASG